MADNVAITAGTGTTVAADEVVDATLGTVKVQYVKIMDGLIDSTIKAGVGANGLKVDPSAVTSPVSAASLPLPTGASTSAKQAALGTAGSASADVLSVQGVASMTPLKTDASATTQPVSASSLPLPTGAATSAKQPALGTAGSASTDVLTIQGIASMTPLKTDNSAVTQPVSAASLPLPTGASTAAKQPALGTAGSASADVLTIQGVASMTAIKVDGSSVTQPVNSSTATGSAVPANAYYAAVQAQNALPTAATPLNLTGMFGDKFGRPVVLTNAVRDLVLPMAQLTLTSTTSETSLIAAVASTFNDIVSLIVINTSATATQVDFRDSTGGTIRLSLYVPAGDMRGIALPTPLPQAGVNTAWTAKCGTSVASVIITGTYIANK